MENIPMLTENALIGIVVPLAGIVLFAGLFLWLITSNNKKLDKENAEEVKEYMDKVDKPMDFDKSKIKSISIEHTQGTKKSIDIKIAVLKVALKEALFIGNQKTAALLTIKIDKLHMDRGAKLSLEDTAMTGDSPPHHSVGMPYAYFEFNPKGSSWAEKYIDKEEHILDKINRLHTEMQECLPVENYERMAEIKKELDEAYEAKPPKDF